MSDFGPRLVKAEVDSEDDFVPLCLKCGADCEEEPEPYAFFLTVYRHGSEREDWFGQLCPKCASSVIDELELTP